MIMSHVNGTPQKCAVIQSSDNTVINLIIADPSFDIAPEGAIIIGVSDDNSVSLGWQYDSSTGEFTDPNPPVEAQV